MEKLQRPGFGACRVFDPLREERAVFRVLQLCAGARKARRIIVEVARILSEVPENFVLFDSGVRKRLQKRMIDDGALNRTGAFKSLSRPGSRSMGVRKKCEAEERRRLSEKRAAGGEECHGTEAADLTAAGMKG